MSLKILPPEVIASIAALLAPGNELLGVCRDVRAACLANATSAIMTRGYEGPVDDVHVATLARCPRLARLDAAELGARDAPWPLASVTRLTSLTIQPRCKWRSKHLPASLPELVVPQEDGDFDSLLKLAHHLRSRSCVIRVHLIRTGRSRLQSLLEPSGTCHVRVMSLVVFDDMAQGCEQLTGLSELASLKFWGFEVRSLDALSGLRSLRQLSLCNCGNLAVAGALPPALAALSITECDELKTVSIVAAGLTSLHLSNCALLTQLELAPGSMPQLHSLAVENCDELDVARAAASVPALRSLALAGHHAEQMRALQTCATALSHMELKYYGCSPSSHDLRPLCALRGLALRTHLELEDFSGLGVDIAAQLTSLTVAYCSRLASMAGLEHVTALKRLQLASCNALRSLSGLAAQSMPELTSLRILRCSTLPWISLPLMPRLRELLLDDCASNPDESVPPTALPTLAAASPQTRPQLAMLASGIQALSLCSLDIRSLCDLGRLEQLRFLHIEQLPHLSSLCGLAALPQLTTLMLSKMRCFTSLHGCSTGLRELVLFHCEALESLAGLEDATLLVAVHLRCCRALRSLQGVAPCVQARPGAVVVKDCHELRDTGNSRRCGLSVVKKCSALWPAETVRHANQMYAIQSADSE